MTVGARFGPRTLPHSDHHRSRIATAPVSGLRRNQVGRLNVQRRAADVCIRRQRDRVLWARRNQVDWLNVQRRAVDMCIRRQRDGVLWVRRNQVGWLNAQRRAADVVRSLAARRCVVRE
ncbi:hypothetical protein ACPPVO_10410 [Dactylosporangium sp. McL0621]|uniref:hypothetical protein n=1 Tax=Dactylosporangium sp. McL0621 TaxID=3415678 RepID=UPI003CEE8C35